MPAASTKSPTLQKVFVDPGSHCWSTTQRIVPFHEVVIGEVKANRSLKILAFLS